MSNRSASTTTNATNPNMVFLPNWATLQSEPACSFLLSDHETLLPNPVIPRTPRGEEYIAPISSTPAIAKAISNACAIRKSLETKRKRLYDILERLYHEETYIDYYIRSHQAVLSQSALRKIPTELLIEVFRLVLFATGAVEDTADESKAVSLRLLELTWVCQRWRHVILNAPLLWSSFHASFRKWRQGQLSLPFMLPQMIATHLERSQQVPLKVSIDLCHNLPPNLCHLVRSGLNALFSEMKCKSLRILHWGPMHTSDPDDFCVPLSDLETLVIDCRMYTAPFFPELPNLRSLTIKEIQSISWLDNVLGSTVPWCSLTSLTIHGKVSIILGVLPFAASLTELAATINHDTDPIPPEMVHLRRLRRLTVSIDEGPTNYMGLYQPSHPPAHDGQRSVRLFHQFLSHLVANELVSLSFPTASMAQIYEAASRPLPINLLYIRSIRTSTPSWYDHLELVDASSALFSDRTPSLKNLEVTSLPGTTLGAYGVRTLHSMTTRTFAYSLTSFSIRYLDLFPWRYLIPIIESLQLTSLTVDFVALKCGEFDVTGERGLWWVWLDEEAEEQWHELCHQVRKLQRTKVRGMDIRLSLRGAPKEEAHALVY